MSSDEKFRVLVEDVSLYPSQFVDNFGKLGKHWEYENWQKRELSLRHDMICILLSNCETRPDYKDCTNIILSGAIQEIRDERQERLGAQMQEEVERNPLIEEFDDDDEEMIGEIGQELVEFNVEEINVNSENQREIDELGLQYQYRYIVIEGHPNEKSLQGFFSRKWGIVLNKLYDIIDTIDKKFIEVKVSLTHEEKILDFSEKYNSEHLALIIINPQTFQINGVNNDIMPGESKAISFLTNRKSIMESLNISDREYNETINLEKFVFKVEKINKILEDFENLYLSGSNEKTELKFDENNVKLNAIYMNKMFEYLDKPIFFEGEDIKWKGKLYPIFYKDEIEASEKDEETIDNFLNFIEFKTFKKYTGENYKEILSEVILLWDSSSITSKQFGIFKVNSNQTHKVPENLRKMLGIGAKRIKKGEGKNMKQPEYDTLKRMKYNKWFDKLYEDMCVLNKYYTTEYAIMNNKEVKPNNRHFATINDLVVYLFKRIGERNVGSIINESENFYSRIGSAYNADKQGKNAQSNIAILPIVTSTTEKNTNKIKRRCSGICIRGPQHCRTATDRINIVTIEIVKDEALIPFLTNYCLIEYTDGTKLLIRRNAIKKVDSTFLNFMNNSLFMPINLIGDMVFNNPEFTSFESIGSISLNLIEDTNSLNFHINRVTDAVLMALIGNSRDEGYFAMIRKMFMILLLERRSESSFSLDLKEFCEKVNENLIDNPLSMFKHNSLLFILCLRNEEL